MNNQSNNFAKMRMALVKAQTALKVFDWPEGVNMDGVRSILDEIGEEK